MNNTCFPISENECSHPNNGSSRHLRNENVSSTTPSMRSGFQLAAVDDMGEGYYRL
jgi:hypothetical protein